MGEGMLSPREDFFYDKEFSELLEHYKDCELVINGDLIDFLQMCDSPEIFHPSQTEKKYGLNTEAEKSAWKVLKQVSERCKTLFLMMGPTEQIPTAKGISTGTPLINAPAIEKFSKPDYEVILEKSNYKKYEILATDIYGERQLQVFY